MAYAYSVLLATSRFDEALEAASLAARLDPVTPMNTAGTAVVWTHMRQYERAVEAFEAALEVNPDCPAVHMWKSFAHLWSGQYHESLLALEQAVPYTLLVEETKAIILAKRNQLRAAENAIERFHARIDQNARVLLSLARVYTALGQIDSAFTWLDRALRGARGRSGTDQRRSCLRSAAGRSPFRPVAEPDAFAGLRGGR